MTVLQTYWIKPGRNVTVSHLSLKVQRQPSPQPKADVEAAVCSLSNDYSSAGSAPWQLEAGWNICSLSEKERERDSLWGGEVRPGNSHSGAQKPLTSFIWYGRLSKALYLSRLFFSEHRGWQGALLLRVCSLHCRWINLQIITVISWRG